MHACRAAMETIERYMVIRGFHVYKTIWDAAIGETLRCKREKDNNSDRYAIAVLQNDVIVGHLPRKYSRVCSLFLDTGGSISCTVSGRRQFSSDLIQGGLEIPCLVKFGSSKKAIKKLTKFLR